MIDDRPWHCFDFDFVPKKHGGNEISWRRKEEFDTQTVDNSKQHRTKQSYSQRMQESNIWIGDHMQNASQNCELYYTIQSIFDISMSRCQKTIRIHKSWMKLSPVNLFCVFCVDYCVFHLDFWFLLFKKKHRFIFNIRDIEAFELNFGHELHFSKCVPVIEHQIACQTCVICSHNIPAACHLGSLQHLKTNIFFCNKFHQRGWLP